MPFKFNTKLKNIDTMKNCKLFFVGIFIILFSAACDKENPVEQKLDEKPSTEKPVNPPSQGSDYIEVESIEIVTEKNVIYFGEDLPVNVKILPENATQQKVAWILDEEVKPYFTIEETEENNFLIRPKDVPSGELKFSITALAGDVKTSKEITVSPGDLYIDKAGVWHLYTKAGWDKWNEEVRKNTLISMSLYTDIELADEWTPINNFKGSINGNGHIIKGLSISNGGKNTGFVSINDGGAIDNLIFDGAAIKGTVNVGTIVGTNNGRILNCNLINKVTVEGQLTVGGLVGFNTYNGEVRNCHVNADGKEGTGVLVTGNMHDTNEEGTGGIVGANANSTGAYIIGCSSSGMKVKGTKRVGGVVGNNKAYVYGCWSSCDVESTENCAGGVVGRHYMRRMAGCYSTGNVYGPDDTGGLAGRSESLIVSSFSYGTVKNSGSGDSNYVGLAVGYFRYAGKDNLPIALYYKKNGNEGTDEAIGKFAPWQEGDTDGVKPVTDWAAAIADMNSSLATYGLNDFYFIMGDSGHPVLKFNSY